MYYIHVFLHVCTSVHRVPLLFYIVNSFLNVYIQQLMMLYWRVCHVKNLLKKYPQDVVKRITTNKTCGMSRHNR